MGEWEPSKSNRKSVSKSYYMSHKKRCVKVEVYIFKVNAVNHIALNILSISRDDRNGKISDLILCNHFP